MTKQLTAAGVAKIKPKEERQEIPDAGCTGLYLTVATSGSKGWAFRFRRPGSRRPARLVLGPVATSLGENDPDPVLGGPLSLASARRLATELKHKVARGEDPAAEHQAKKMQVSATDAYPDAARAFIRQHAMKETRRWQGTARLLGLDGDLEAIPKGLCDRWRDWPVSRIDEDEIFRTVREARDRGVPGLEQRNDGSSEPRARALFSALSTLFSWLKEERMIKVNPVLGLKRPDPPKARTRVLSDDEVRKFWKAADAERLEFGNALKMLLLTGQRLNEVAGMRRSELNGETWTIPEDRTKNHRKHVVPLPPSAQQLIAAVVSESDFTFTTDGQSKISIGSKIKNRLDAAMGNPPDWVLHDLRRTCATGMAEIGIAPHIVEACINHISGAKAGVAGVYNRAEYAAEKKVALERWAVHVDGLVTGKQAKVVRLR